MEPGSGRRASDHDVEPVVEMRIQEVVADTRHRLIQEITVLAASQADAKLLATREHGEVRADIQGLRTDVAALRQAVAELTPLRESVEALKHRDELEAARQETANEMLLELQKQRAQFRTFMVGIAGVVVAASSVLVAVLT